MKINQTGENKGFAFLTFDSTEVVDEICENRYHRIGPHMVEVKKAQSKHEQKSSHNDNNNGPNSYNSTAYYGNSPHSQGGGAYGEAASYYPNPIPTFYIPTFPTLPGTYSDSGDYIGGTWYPKQQGTLESDDIANQTPPYVPQAIYYPTLPPYPGTPYAAFPSYPAAFVQPQKDI
jgi:RNA recognition motif-containing protein